MGVNQTKLLQTDNSMHFYKMKWKHVFILGFLISSAAATIVRFDPVTDVTFSEFLETIDMSSKGSMKKVKMECMSRCKKNSLCAGISLKSDDWNCYLASLTAVNSSESGTVSYMMIPESMFSQTNVNSINLTNNYVGVFGYVPDPPPPPPPHPRGPFPGHFFAGISIVSSEYGDDVYDCCDQCFTQYVDVSTSGWCDCMTMMEGEKPYLVESDSHTAFRCWKVTPGDQYPAGNWSYSGGFGNWSEENWSYTGGFGNWSEGNWSYTDYGNWSDGNWSYYDYYDNYD